MKIAFPIAALLALLAGACSANSPPAAAQAIVQAQDAADAAAADLPTADGDAADESVAVADTAADSEPAETQPADAQLADAAKPLPNTNGLQVPPLALPEFTQVVDSTGQSVSKDELLGHYTVLWFYPAASTGG